MTKQKQNGNAIISGVRLVLITIGTTASFICFYYIFLSINRVSYAILNAQNIGSDRKLSCNNFCHLSNHWQPKATIFSESLERSEWGTWRPGIYFGTKAKSLSYPLATGIMWTSSLEAGNKFRHQTQQDELSTFEWNKHDGSSFGVESLKDSSYDMNIVASFASVKDSGFVDEGLISSGLNWIQSIKINPINGYSDDRKRFIFYIGKESIDHELINVEKYKLKTFDHTEESEGLAVSLVGYSEENRKWFHLLIKGSDKTDTKGENKSRDDDDMTTISYTGLRNADILNGVESIEVSAKNHQFYQLGHDMKSRGKMRKSKSLFNDDGEFNDDVQEDSSFSAFQVGFKSSLRVDVLFFDGVESSNDNYYENLISSLENNEFQFENQFEIESTLEGNTNEIKNDSIKTSDLVDEIFNKMIKSYDEKFELKIGKKLKEENLFSETEIIAAQNCLSSLIGGIGFFYGTPRIGDAKDISINPVPQIQLDEQSTKEIKKNSPIPITLYSGSPSRTAFPRGFLWDEGYHQMVLNHWDVSITIEVITSWLNTMHFPAEDACVGTDSDESCVGGWIPREMILGEEARRRVPEEFITQRVNIANPPTLLLVVDQLLDRLERGTLEVEEAEKVKVFLGVSYPLFHQWVQWFLHSQRGSFNTPGSFRWRGRSESDGKVIPNTLASGLDDYPRAVRVSEEEHHVDLHCWMARSCAIMARLEEAIEKQGIPLSSEISELTRNAEYKKKYEYLLQRLDDLHWSDKYQGFFDVGLNSEEGVFTSEVIFRCSDPSTKKTVDISVPIEILNSGSKTFCPPPFSQPLYPLGDGRGGYHRVERYRAINYEIQHVPRVGYVSLFPFLLKLLPAESPKLSKVLDMVEDPKLLWSDYGLRSMATTDRYYQRGNSNDDAPYWRGAIWINLNYLALSALHHYSELGEPNTRTGPTALRCRRLYTELRTHLLKTVLGNYEKTGFFWEQYDDVTGKGIRGHPFTGWTSLIVNIMAELY